MTHVLIAEDLPAFSNDIARALVAEHPSWEVTACSSAGEVAAVLNQGIEVDVALIDLDLGQGPNASGLDALDSVKTLRPGAHRVIFTSDVEGNRWLLMLAAISLFEPRGFISKTTSTRLVAQQLISIADGKAGGLAGLGEPELEWFRALVGHKGDFNMWRAMSKGATTTQQLADLSHFAIRTINRFLERKAELIAATPHAGRRSLRAAIALATPQPGAGNGRHLLPVSTIATAHPLVFQSDLVEDWAELH